MSIFRLCRTWEVGRGCVSPRWLSLSLKNTSLPTPTDHPQRFLELSNQRRVSIMDAGSGRLGDVLCVVRPYHHLTSPYVGHAANSGLGRRYTRCCNTTAYLCAYLGSTDVPAPSLTFAKVRTGGLSGDTGRSAWQYPNVAAGLLP